MSRLALSLTLLGSFACTGGSGPEPQPEGAIIQTIETVELPVEGYFFSGIPWFSEQPNPHAGYGGYNRGGFGGKGIRQPQIRHSKAQVTGSLERDVIRGIVRAHIPEVRTCYNAGLTKDPDLQGRLVVEFVIGAKGKVLSAKVHEATVKDAAVGTCIAKAVELWTFPKPPGGGNVTVLYPFNLSPG